MFEIAEDGERVLDQLVRALALDVGNKADTTGILLARGIIKALRRRQSRIRAVAKAKRWRARRDPVTSSLCAISCRAHPRPRLSPRRKRRGSVCRLAHRSRPQRRWASRPQRVPLVIGGPSRYRAPAQARLAARVRQPPRCPMAPLITVQCGRDDKPAEEYRAGRQLGQQYCPSLPCQILIMNARVRLSRKSSFAFEVSSSVPKKPSEQVCGRAPGTEFARRIRGHRASVALVERFPLVPGVKHDEAVEVCR